MPPNTTCSGRGYRPAGLAGPREVLCHNKLVTCNPPRRFPAHCPPEGTDLHCTERTAVQVSLRDDVAVSTVLTHGVSMPGKNAGRDENRWASRDTRNNPMFIRHFFPNQEQPSSPSESAIAELTRAIQAHPGDYANYWNRAFIYDELKKYQQAVDDY